MKTVGSNTSVPVRKDIQKIPENYTDIVHGGIEQNAKSAATTTISGTVDKALTTEDLAGASVVTLFADTTASDVTYTFPPAADIVNVTFPYKKIAGSNALILDANGSEEINGALTISTSDQGHVYSDGTALWAVLGA